MSLGDGPRVVREGIAMEPAGIRVTRSLAIDGALLGPVLLYLRRDAAASVLRWTLGERGTVEIDPCFRTSETGWEAPARLWSPNGLAVAAATVHAEPVQADEVVLRIEPTLPPRGWGDGGERFAVLAECALDELAEELLWHASRAGVTHRPCRTTSVHTPVAHRPIARNAPLSCWARRARAVRRAPP